MQYVLFSTTTMIVQTRINVKSYVYCLSLFLTTRTICQLHKRIRYATQNQWLKWECSGHTVLSGTLPVFVRREWRNQEIPQDNRLWGRKLNSETPLRSKHTYQSTSSFVTNFYIEIRFSYWHVNTHEITQPLTLWRLTTYIYICVCVCVCVCVCASYSTANLQTLHFKYLLKKYTYWIF